jgi:DNA-binding transcriptional LysR family regulator
MLDVRRLRLLRELKIRGTLAEVASALNFSPSSVSQQLTLLEKEAGVELLRKTGRKVQLTPQAEILVEHTAALLDRLEQAESDLAASLTTVTGTVRLAVFQSAALALMPDALTNMGADYPEVRIEMIQREPETALYETWARDFDLAVPPAALDRHGITSVDDAAGAAWVMEPRGAASRHWAEQACRRAGFEPDVRYETADLQAQIRLIESGNAIAFMPDLVWTGRGTTCQLLELPGKPRRTVFTSVRRASSHRPAILTFRKVLEQTARKIEDGKPA